MEDLSQSDATGRGARWESTGKRYMLGEKECTASKDFFVIYHPYCPKNYAIYWKKIEK